MKILLLGEYSNLHWTLAQGLRSLGHEVTVVSSGDGYKGYRNDIQLKRKGYGKVDTLRYVAKLLRVLPSFRGYDVVQLINPSFLNLRIERELKAFHFLKRNNGKIFLGAFGDDHYWVKACAEKKLFRYSEFDIPGRTDYIASSKKLMREWIGTEKERVNRQIAEQVDGIIACLYEYYESYKQDFEDKLVYIPAPINTHEISYTQRGIDKTNTNFFIGIQKHRTECKGADVLLRVLEQVHEKYPQNSSLLKAESVPYTRYMQMMTNSDVLLDQLYSYTPGMNALGAMAKGLVVVGGGEPETYEILGETENKPIVNVLPDEQDIFRKLENLIADNEQIADLSRRSRMFIEKHHDYVKVARQYLDFWTK
ncbi:glycosyltransferase involved in cell wall biosynthesis [Dysgonomonas sp. PH5-45]|uniref:glycosyltransferase family protein n=1 Tax=unclassified Dysgonomonas TaxID=2630389 RepID=UPI002475A499|nr:MULTISPECIES: glycosyltransferase [unclassified Dysgonomonas]MDH6353723.1 glycosyltransferase involved in cell wall biosynthesis [Dysgonomonas sp. PH5-45]MDH6386626.1 glycosyltransferase involved in cell wall biosynthesis [Dysgonomonas sp. PH5-37]